MSVDEERSGYPVPGFEKSYKRLEENREAHSRVMDEEFLLRKTSLPSNKPMERTLPRCALQRRSSAR